MAFVVTSIKLNRSLLNKHESNIFDPAEKFYSESWHAISFDLAVRWKATLRETGVSLFNNLASSSRSTSTTRGLFL